MLGLLIILIAFGLGLGTGYGWREMISRRRRRLARGELAEAAPPRREPLPPRREPLGAATAGDDAINLERLLVAANDDHSARRRQQPRTGLEGDQPMQSEEFDGAVRDLLGELNRRPQAPSSASHRQRP